MTKRRAFRRLLGVLFLIISLPLCSGCWDQQTPEDIGIVLGIAVSAHEEWTFLFPNPAVTISSLASLSNSGQFYSIAVKASSYQEALRRVQLQSSRQVFIGDLRLLVVSADLSADKLSPIIDTLTLDGVVPDKLWLVASQTTPSSVLLHLTPQTIVPSYYLARYFDCLTCQPANFGVRDWEWWDHRVTPGVSPTIPLVTPTATGGAVDQILVYPSQGPPLIMPRSATEGWAYLEDKMMHGTLTLPVDGQTYIVAPIRGQTALGVTLTAHGVDARVVIHAQGQIAGMPPNLIVTQAIERDVDRAASRAIVHRCLEAIHWANQTHTDPFGYAERAAWQQDALAATIPSGQWVHLPIHARVSAQFLVQGERNAR